MNNERVEWDSRGESGRGAQMVYTIKPLLALRGRRHFILPRRWLHFRFGNPRCMPRAALCINELIVPPDISNILDLWFLISCKIIDNKYSCNVAVLLLSGYIQFIANYVTLRVHLLGSIYDLCSWNSIYLYLAIYLSISISLSLSPSLSLPLSPSHSFFL